MTPRGCISLVFDDGYDEVYRLVVPLLEKYNFSGVFALPLQPEKLTQETKQEMKIWSEWTTITAQGHELAAHSITHTDLTTLSTEQLDKELHQPADTLKATTLVYPGGAHNETVVAAAQRFYRAGRTVQAGFNSVPPVNPWRLKSYNFSKNNFSVFKANRLALQAWLTNSWLIETYHLVSDQPSDLVHSTSLADFERHLKFLKRLSIPVKTIRAVIEIG